MLTPLEIKRIVRQIVDRMRPERVIVFGSYAKGTATVRSDLDILVIAETVLPMEARADVLAPILSQRPIPVDVHVYTPEEIDAYGSEPLSFIASVLKSGTTVFKRQ